MNDSANTPARIALVVCVTLGLIWAVWSLTGRPGPTRSPGSGVGGGGDASPAASPAALPAVPSSRQPIEGPEVVAVPDGGRAAEANAADCLALADTAAAERCFRDLMAADPDAAARLIGAALCAKLGDGTADQVTDRNVALCVRLWRNRVVLAELSTMYGMCPGWMCSDALERALRHAIEADPSLIDLLEDEISPELLFDAEQNVFPIVAARELWLLRASDRTKKILRSGAMGQSGGTTLQVDYAALMSASLVTDPMERLAFVTDVASSPSLPDGVDRVGMGSTMMHLLYDRSIREGLTERELVEATIELLNSEQLGIGAAGHLLDLLTDAPPPITEATWEEVRAHAKLRYDG